MDTPAPPTSDQVPVAYSVRSDHGSVTIDPINGQLYLTEPLSPLKTFEFHITATTYTGTVSSTAASVTCKSNHYRPHTRQFSSPYSAQAALSLYAPPLNYVGFSSPYSPLSNSLGSAYATLQNTNGYLPTNTLGTALANSYPTYSTGFTSAYSPYPTAGFSSLYSSPNYLPYPLQNYGTCLSSSIYNNRCTLGKTLQNLLLNSFVLSK